MRRKSESAATAAVDDCHENVYGEKKIINFVYSNESKAHRIIVVINSFMNIPKKKNAKPRKLQSSPSLSSYWFFAYKK